jgi:glucokinase
MKNIVIDMGGTRIKLALFMDGQLTGQTIIPAYSQNHIIQVLDNVEKEIGMLMADETVSSIDNVAISVPGIVDTKERKILSINDKYNSAVGFDFTGWGKEKFGAEVCMENDARAALIGEWLAGAGKGVDNLVIMTLGTGIGGAALMEGRLVRGKHYLAGCLGGHFTIDFQGAVCNCGNIGCAETVGSSWALPQMAEKMGFAGDKVDFKVLFDAMKAGDVAATKVVNVCLEAWCACAINLVHAYDPEMVILGGGVMNNAGVILPEIRAWVHRHSWTPWGDVRIERAMLGDAAALYGMEGLIEREIKNVR